MKPPWNLVAWSRSEITFSRSGKNGETLFGIISYIERYENTVNFTAVEIVLFKVEIFFSSHANDSGDDTCRIQFSLASTYPPWWSANQTGEEQKGEIAAHSYKQIKIQIFCKKKQWTVIDITVKVKKK